MYTVSSNSIITVNNDSCLFVSQPLRLSAVVWYCELVVPSLILIPQIQGLSRSMGGSSSSSDDSTGPDLCPLLSACNLLQQHHMNVTGSSETFHGRAQRTDRVLEPKLPPV